MKPPKKKPASRKPAVTKTKKAVPALVLVPSGYSGLLDEIGELVNSARQTSVRAVNALMTATYWEVGRRVVEFEQGGKQRAEYGDALLERLSEDLTTRLGRGFGMSNLALMRKFFLSFGQIFQTLSGKSAEPKKQKRIFQTLSGKSSTSPELTDIARAFPLPWSHYVLLITRARSQEAAAFYHAGALSGGWSVRQLQRQMDTQFYERTALSRNKAAMLAKGGKAQPKDALSVEEEIRHPFVLEFLGLRDEYSENDMEAALVGHLESFLLELGQDFAFVGRQRRLRIDDDWYRIDLLFFHRRLRCLVIFDLKLGRFSHSDAGQMHVYLNYAREHWMQEGENPPIGVILCSGKSEALVRYATDSLPTKMLVREYLTALPDEKVLVAELEAIRRRIEARR